MSRQFVLIYCHVNNKITSNDWYLGSNCRYKIDIILIHSNNYLWTRSYYYIIYDIYNRQINIGRLI